MSRRRHPLFFYQLVALTFLGVAGMVSVAGAILPPPQFISMWGTGGSGNGQFNGPAGVAVDGAGNVYVADTGNNRIQKFDPNGVYISSWGSSGSGPGQFSGPFGIAVKGYDVYVVDSGNYRVQKFTTAGAYVTSWGGLGTGNGQFQQPLCVAISPYGSVFVTDYNLNRVQEFTNTGTFVNVWGGTGSGAGQFNGCAGIAIDNSYAVYVTDSGNHRVEIWNTSGSYTSTYGTGPSAALGSFNYPFGIANWGGHTYVVDTFNNRMQQFSPPGSFETWWAGGSPFTQPHAAAAAFNLIYVADTDNNRIQKFGPAPPETCLTCLSPPDTCCEGIPHVGGPWSNILVGTRQPSSFSGWPYAVTIFNLNSPPVPPEDQDWASMIRYNGPGNSWSGDSLGTVFGLTLDKSGNIFVTHTSCYQGDQIGQVFGGAPGAIYRIDGNTGAINTFCVLPNFPDGSVTPPEEFPGLGNITYDCRHDQFFVTNLEDGKIYRIKPTGTIGTVVETFDPLAPDNGTNGWAALGERLWGIQWHGDRVYYSVWASDLTGSAGPNEIRSVGIQTSGAFAGGSDQHELYLPPLTGSTYSMPVADISFSASGKMLLGERGIQQLSYPAPHLARVLEYVCSAGCWIQGNYYGIGDYGAQTNAAGGVDYDRMPFGGPGNPIGRVWATGDALHLYGSYPDAVYGYQGLRPNINGTNITSMLVDSDGNVINGDKTFPGDVEVPGCPVLDPIGTLCGQKFNDLNHNGVKDGAETGLSGWTIQCGPYSAVTDANGNYCITGIAPGSYTVSEIGQAGWVQTAPAGGTYSITISAGQTLYGYVFGNYLAAAGTAPCVSPPTGMAAWWPFNEPTTSTTAGDITHTSPAKNVAQLFGSAAITAGGYVKRSLCFPTELDYAKVPFANQTGLQFGAQPFTIDVWVKAPNASGPRIIAEHRRLVSPSPYKTNGWALYLNGLQATIELGWGISTQIITGPTIPANTWTHLAVVVERAPSAGKWYMNGAIQTAFNFAPAVASMSPNTDLYMGQASPPFGTAALQGCIDELEIFNGTAVSATSIQKIYAAGTVGKCPEYCRLPSVTTICKTQNSVQVCFNICNNNPTAQTYSWSLAGLPVGPGCSVSGPTVFNPPAGSVTVPGGSCSAPICVTIPRPSGLTTQGATSCYSLTFVNNATGVSYSCTGTIRADYSCWCLTPLQTGVVYVGRAASGTLISIGIGHPCDPIGSATYRISAVFTNTDHQDPLEVSLNGLPPGEPVIGTLDRGAGGTGQVNVGVSYPNGYDEFGWYEILLEADTDGDGVYDVDARTMVASAPDSSSNVDIVDGPKTPDSVRLISSPNPFFRGSMVEFSLAARDQGELSVFDLSGRLVRTLKSGAFAAGPHRVEWNGVDDRGHLSPAGVYFVRLETGRVSLRTKLVKLN